MNRAFLVVLTIITMALTTGCGSPDTSNAAPTVTASATPELSEDTRRDMVLDLIQSEYPELSGAEGRRTVGVLVDEICPFFDNGHTFEEYAQVTVDSGMEPGMAGYVAGATVAGLCPEYSDIFDDTAANGDLT